MFTVKTPEEVLRILSSEFPFRTGTETVPLHQCCGRILAEDVIAEEYVPGFDRSTVDGYAVRASDTFGCSDSIPAILPVTDEIFMGQEAAHPLAPGSCAAIPTGGALPEGADAVVMIEYTEDYGDGTVGILKPAAPGMNLIYRGDDVFPGKVILPAGRKLTASDAGALAASGKVRVSVRKKPVVGILSTGDELVPPDQVPAGGQIRDVNSSLLEAMIPELGGEPRCFGIIPDIPERLDEAVSRALAECDMVLISGGSSVGEKDAAARVIGAHGEILLHGIAMKPGKPTILGRASGKPVFGLPGHPVAAFFITQLFVRPLLASMTGRNLMRKTMTARLAEAVSTNHGRSEALGVRLRTAGDVPLADPVHTKSGLISALAGSDGYITIPRDCEGLAAGSEVSVFFFTTD